MWVIRKGRGAELFVHQKMFWINYLVKYLVFNLVTNVSLTRSEFKFFFLLEQKKFCWGCDWYTPLRYFPKIVFRTKDCLVIPMPKLNVAPFQMSFSLCWVSDADAKDMTAAKISVAANAWSCKVTLLNYPQWWCMECTLTHLVWWFIK